MNRLPKHPITGAAQHLRAPHSDRSLSAPIAADHSPCAPLANTVCAQAGVSADCAITGTPALITADCRTTTPRQFLDALGFAPVREALREQDRNRCIAAIKRGSAYGYPPSLVAECKAAMAGQLPEGWSRVEL